VSVCLCERESDREKETERETETDSEVTLILRLSRLISWLN